MTATATGPSDAPGQEFTRELFGRVDALDAPGYARLVAPDARLTFGNQQPLSGPDDVARTVAGLFATTAGLHHTVAGLWRAGDTTVVELSAAHDRRDGRTVAVPAAAIHAGGTA